MKFRIGQGFDFHPFVQGRPLMLGGVRIPFPMGLKGHSDADALLHAVCDALLGAAGLGDIGTQFPDTDPQYAGISSLLLLGETMKAIGARGWKVGNVDLTVITEQPKIGPHVEAIRSNLAGALGLQPEEVGVKATTMEGKGAIGRGDGIAVLAVTSLIQSENPGSKAQT